MDWLKQIYKDKYGVNDITQTGINTITNNANITDTISNVNNTPSYIQNLVNTLTKNNSLSDLNNRVSMPENNELPIPQEIEDLVNQPLPFNKEINNYPDTQNVVPNTTQPNVTPPPIIPLSNTPTNIAPIDTTKTVPPTQSNDFTNYLNNENKQKYGSFVKYNFNTINDYFVKN